MSNIVISGDKLIFRKPLWEESEVLMAQCYWFSVDTDTMTVTADIRTTFRKAMHEFISYCYPAFWSQPQYQDEKVALLADIDKEYKRIYDVVRAKLKAKLPWWNKLRKHQKDALLQMYYVKSVVLSMEPRLGKSITANSIAAACDISRTVIVSYDIGKRNFMYDLTDPKWNGESVWNKLHFTILDRQKKKALEAFDEKFAIVNYESLKNFLKTIYNGPPVGLIIISECQKIKNPNSGLHRAVAKLISMYPDARIIFESGTPVMNRSNDLFAYFKLASHPLGANYADFKRKFSEVDSRHGTVVGSVGIDELRRLSMNFIIRKTQAECTDMPRHNYINMYFELGEWQQKYKKAIYDSMHASGKMAVESAIHSINRIMAMAKVDGVIEAVELMVDAGKKVVIFSNYTDPLLKMQAHFGKSCTLINGQTKDKFKEAQRFKDDPECMVLLGNTDSAGHTVDLSVSSNLYVLDFPLSPKKLEQAADRVKNLNKSEPCNVHFCISKGNGKVPTVDERLRDLIGGKDSDINALMDGAESKGFQDDVAQVLWRELLEQYSNQGNESEEELGEAVEERSNG